MSILTDVYENAIIGLMTGAVASIVAWTPYLSLLSAISNAETGSVTEVTYTGYLGRRLMNPSAASQDGSSNAQTSNNALIQFGTNTGASVNIVGIGVHTASSGGELRFVIPISTVAIPTNGQPEIAAGTFVLRLS